MAEQSRSVLVVEDDPAFGRLLTDVLRGVGHDAVLAPTGAEALRLMAASLPAVVFVDVDLPDGTGWTVLEEMDRRGIAPDRVVVSSASLAALQHDRPGVFVLRKPFPIQSLLRLIDGDEFAEI
jgi:CheY-like chemotaxis protein